MPGGTRQIKLRTTSGGAQAIDVAYPTGTRYVSSDERIATVDEHGLITGLTAGRVTIAFEPGEEVLFFRKGTIPQARGGLKDTWWLVDNGFIGADGWGGVGWPTRLVLYCGRRGVVSPPASGSRESQDGVPSKCCVSQGLSMDTTKPSSFSVSPSLLARLLDGPSPPLLVDVRKEPAFTSSGCMLPGALRRDPLQVAQWVASLPPAQTVVVYCIHGHEVGVNTMQALRQHGRDACFLEGGIEAWCELGLPVQGKPVAGPTRWVTRARPRIDRIACPWLIRRFVDVDAQFLYVPTDQLASVARREQATAYDVVASVLPTPFTHEGERCSFDAFIQRYRLAGDPALARLALIVRGADTDRLDLSPQSGGLVAMSLGMARIELDDHRMLAAMLPLYDALYAWCQDAVRGQDEKHTWNATPQSNGARA